MAATEYKALTFIHFPFIERSFSPGEMIDHSVFEEFADAAAAAVPVHDDERGGYAPTAEEQIDHFLEWGSLSEDPDAELHPDHRPVDPSKPSLALLIEQAKEMVADLESRQQEVPDELRALADTDYRHIVAAGDEAKGGDTHA